jgi:hypothetical protein
MDDLRHTPSKPVEKPVKLKSVSLSQKHHAETIKVSRFVNAALAALENGADVKSNFDSCMAEAGLERPKMFDELAGRMPDGTESEVLGAILDGCEEYAARHGSGPSPDVVEAAIQQGVSCFNPKSLDGRPLYDSATSSAHDQISLQPNRAVTAIIRTIAEAIPFAGYLPVDIGSNQSKVIIAQTLAGSNFGDYTIGATLEGVNCGGNYALAYRLATMTSSDRTSYAVQFFTGNLTTGEPDTTTTPVKVLRGRTNVYVNGLLCGSEVPNSNSTVANSPITGSVTIDGVTYTFTGAVTIATGAVTVTFSSQLPATMANGNAIVVSAEAYIDYDSQPGLIPLVTVIATTYDLFATENRIYTANTFGSAQQMRNEAGLDPETLATVKFQDQHTMERHYKFLKFARINGAANNSRTFNMNFVARGNQLTRAMIIQDLAATIGAASQQMANDTMDHGITHIYTGQFFGSILQGCPDFIWRPAGVPARAGIYKLGTLFGMYEVYYSPKVVQEAADGSASELICVGVSTQPARNPFLMGDAVPPTLLPLATNPDLKRQAAYYVRDFTQPNPHQVSGRGCALIKLTNMV